MKLVINKIIRKINWILSVNIDARKPPYNVYSKDKEISQLNNKLEKFKKTIEESNSLYESMLDKTTQSLEKILSNTETISKIQ